MKAVYQTPIKDSVTKQNLSKLNQLLHSLPDGMVVDAAWLEAHDYSSSLRNQYVKNGWLDQPARRVYAKPKADLTWQQVVISLQSLLKKPLHVGGRTALELHGFSHYVSERRRKVFLYGPEKPPSWLKHLNLGVEFEWRNSDRLFPRKMGHVGPQSGIAQDPDAKGVKPLHISSSERAALELLDELPDHESFDVADKVMEGLTTLRPKRLQALLTACKSVKVKRLFLFFSSRHHLTWFSRIDEDALDLGSGKRVIAAGGKLDPQYQITMPSDLFDEV